jgi:hypothetical protein
MEAVTVPTHDVAMYTYRIAHNNGGHRFESPMRYTSPNVPTTALHHPIVERLEWQKRGCQCARFPEQFPRSSSAPSKPGCGADTWWVSVSWGIRCERESEHNGRAMAESGGPEMGAGVARPYPGGSGREGEEERSRYRSLGAWGEDADRQAGSQPGRVLRPALP